MPVSTTPLDTGYTNALGAPGWGIFADKTDLYEGLATMAEADGARKSESRMEDRFLAFVAGALPSEVWS